MEVVQKSKKTELPYVPTTLLLGLYLKKAKKEKRKRKKEKKNQKDTCTSKFTAALFTNAKIRKQSKCLLTDEWIKKK